MLKKKLLILFFITCLVLCTGCNTVENLIHKDKPSINYYTQELSKDISLNPPYSIRVFYKEFFEEFTFPETEVKDILNFINVLNEKYFIEKPEDLPDSYKYKVYLDFDKSKYAITIFNEKYISLYKWDGNYEVDYIDMTDIPVHLNLYSICKYFTKE